MDKKERIENFMAALTELAYTHGIYVDACGCCNSPWLTDIETGEDLAEHLDFRNGKYTYTVTA